jgi:2-polyprenyl-6-hydroxyphenyl methylase/3-demethylubiquinone-9 3-methyltransferase
MTVKEGWDSAPTRVLDVAAGTGNVAIRAAMAGGAVVAADLTPENFASGRLAAAAAGVEVEWAEADAEARPRGDQEFEDVVSCHCAYFAPDHPQGRGGDFFRLLAPFAPPLPPRAVPPVMWGDEDHVRKLFGLRVASLEMRRRVYVERAASPGAYLDLFKRTFGPMVAIYASLANQPDRTAALDRGFLDFVSSANQSTREESVEIPYEYLLIVARKGR